MYHRGHAHGTRRQSHTQSAWYAAIEAATLAEIEATWPDPTTSTPQEVPSDQDALTTVPTVIPMPSVISTQART